MKVESTLVSTVRADDTLAQVNRAVRQRLGEPAEPAQLMPGIWQVRGGAAGHSLHPRSGAGNHLDVNNRSLLDIDNAAPHATDLSSGTPRHVYGSPLVAIRGGADGKSPDTSGNQVRPFRLDGSVSAATARNKAPSRVGRLEAIVRQVAHGDDDNDLLHRKLDRLERAQNALSQQLATRKQPQPTAATAAPATFAAGGH